MDAAPLARRGFERFVVVVARTATSETGIGASCPGGGRLLSNEMTREGRNEAGRPDVTNGQIGGRVWSISCHHELSANVR